MGAQVVSFVRRQSAPVDWTRDEIAQLYRIEHALVQSGLTLDVDRGVTDEGDPWFVFCRPDGEVLIHLTRFDGLYHLYSPALSSPLTGRSFIELTKEFSSRVPLQVTLQRGHGNGPRLFVHPAAMLAVVIGTIFVASNDLVFSSQTADGGEKKSDAASEVVPHKAFLQSTFHLYLENFLNWVRDGAVLQPLPHLSLLTTIAAFIVGSDTATTDTDQSHEGQSANAHGKTVAEVSDALLAALNGATDRTVATEKLVQHSAASPPSDLVVADGSQKTQEAVAPMDYIKSVANYAALAESNKTDSSTADLSVSVLTIADNLSTNATAESTNGSDLQPATFLLNAVIDGASAINVSDGDKLDIVLSGSSESIDLSNSAGVHELVLAGNGDVYIAGIAETGPLSLYIASGSQEQLFLSYQELAVSSSVMQTITLAGADTVSLAEVVKASLAAIRLTVDSEGSQANTLNLADVSSQSGSPSATFDIKLVGSQALTLNESAATFNNSALDASGLNSNLTVGIDFGATVSVTDLTVGASNFVVNQSDSVALVGLADNSQISLDTNLDTVILNMGANAGPGNVSLILQPSAQDAIEINTINALYLTGLSIESNSAGANQANEIASLIDANLSVLTISGNGALTIESIYGVGDSNGQNITIDAHALTAPLTLNVSGIDDISGGGRVITIIGGSDGSVLTNMVVSENTVFTGGAGINAYNIGGGAILDTITDLKAADTVNIGSVLFTDGFINGLAMSSAGQTVINAQNDLIDAALAASQLLGNSAAHQAVLFSYQGSEYVFVNGAGGNAFDTFTDAIVKVVGLSAGASLAGVFHSA